MAQLVELDLLAAGPALADLAKVVREHGLGEAFAGAGVEQVRAVEARRNVGERGQRRRRDDDDPRLAVLRRLLTAFAGGGGAAIRGLPFFGAFSPPWPSSEKRITTSPR